MKTKHDLIQAVYERNHFNKKTVETIVNEFVGEIIALMEAGENVRVAELGTFRTMYRPPCVGYNPDTREKIDVDERHVPHLRFNRAIGRRINAKNK